MNKYEENVAEGWKKMINMVEKWSECIVYIFCFPFTKMHEKDEC